jgi:hypothetical protein
MYGSSARAADFFSGTLKVAMHLESLAGLKKKRADISGYKPAICEWIKWSG